jgi:formate hydrogenlyase subunit 3/multisubunit Na+/H+ antiporter MnhD subunit
VRLALFPLHAWLPIVAKHGTVAVGVVFLVGVKVGIYALLRFVLPLLPAAAQQWDGCGDGAGLGGDGVRRVARLVAAPICAGCWRLP